MAKYNKFWIALIGVILIGLDQFFNISLSVNAESIMNIVIPILTALGVWAIPNNEG